MKTISIDLETRSSVDLSKSGVYKYAESEDFAILLFGVSIDHGPVRVYDLASGDQIPEPILLALTDRSITKSAYNASFERVCLSRWLCRNRPDLLPSGFLDPAGWQCTLVWGACNGLPLGLEKIGAALGLPEQKLKEGKDLIRYFCTPSRTAGRLWNLPSHAPEKWESFKKYNERDVEVELQIRDRLSKYPLPERIWEEYRLDQEINDRGIRIDRELVRQAIRMDELSKTDLTKKLKQLTGLENPNSVSQLKQYLADQGIHVESLGKKEAADLIPTVPADIAKVLELRLQIAKSSISKYKAMENCVCADGRCRGLFQFYGASRTGRWAGRLIQLQNLPQNHLPDLAQVRDLVLQGDYEMLSMLYPSVPGVLSELIRTAFIPEDGKKFIVADYSAVEARALSFLAGEQWRIDVFHSGRDIYCESASRMFHVPVVKNGENGHLRQRGKVAELALGYGGSVGALKAMDAVRMGVPEEELKPLVDAWREANPNITSYWWKIDEAVKTAIEYRIPQRVGNIHFAMKSGALFITLPSGRHLVYLKPMLEENTFGGESITYFGTDAQKHWCRVESYGPKIVENIVQALCRDLLADTMLRLEQYFSNQNTYSPKGSTNTFGPKESTNTFRPKGVLGGRSESPPIVAHIHDEVILEVPFDTSVNTICTLMSQSPAWLPGLELQADGYECSFYRKS